MNALVADAHGLKPEVLAKERCPKCGSPIELRTGRFGPYLACVKYKDTCDYVKSLKKGSAPDRPSDEKCHLCGSPMVIKTGRFGEFLACTTYPACKGTRSIPMGMKCPKCLEGDLAERRTKRGKSFWGCVRYPGLRFLHLESPGARDLPRVRLARHGEEDQQGRGREPHLPQVRPQDRSRRARGGGAGVKATVVGGGLAGSEAAWALAERGVRVTLYEMRPQVPTPAHQTDRLAELVCSNSFKSVDLTNAHGLLKAELRGARQSPPALRRRCAGARRHGARGGSRGLLPGGARAGHRASQHHGGARRGCRAAFARHRGHRAAHLRRAWRAAMSSRLGIRGAGVLRCDRAGGGRRLARSRPALRAVPLRQGRGRRLPQRAARPGGVRARSSTRWSRPTSITGTSSTRCRISRAACRWRRWRGGAGRRCGSGR